MAEKFGINVEKLTKMYKLSKIKEHGVSKSINTLFQYGFVPNVEEKRVVFMHPQKKANIVSSFDDIGAAMLVGYTLGLVDAR
jgi:hypothetical protein